MEAIEATLLGLNQKTTPLPFVEKVTQEKFDLVNSKDRSLPNHARTIRASHWYSPKPQGQRHLADTEIVPGQKSRFKSAPRLTEPTQTTLKSVRPRKKPTQFTPLPRPLSKLLPLLLEGRLIAKEPPRPNPPRFSGYDETQFCAYHMGEKGHNTDNCLILKKKVQALMDSKILKFDEMESNAQQDPLSDHQGVNLVYGEEKEAMLDFSINVPKSQDIPNVASLYPEGVRERK